MWGGAEGRLWSKRFPNSPIPIPIRPPNSNKTVFHLNLTKKKQTSHDSAPMQRVQKASPPGNDFARSRGALTNANKLLPEPAPSFELEASPKKA